jgi:HD-GYP domain-containing protein (c-di-GMP phosphodiesterase class II)
VAYEHHERENGQGYPRGIKGDEICEYAKITGIVDTYEAMTHNRAHRKAIIQNVSIRELILSKNLMFSPKIIKAFIKEISLYPTADCFLTVRARS